VRLSRERRDWADGVVGGAHVGVSNALGPAAVGIVRPRVVIPRWVLALDDAAQRAIVAHEQEHQRTRDPALLVAGLVAVVLMPWNAGVWLAWRGLRLAIEFDCDERVLARGVDRAGYAQVLLGAWGLTRGSWLPTAALTRASGLGSRVQHLMRPEPRRRGMKTLLGIAAAAVLVIAACETPAPQQIAGPPGPDASRNVAAAVMTTDPLVIIDGVRQRGDTLVIRALQGDVTVYGNAAQDAGDRISVGRNVPRIAVDSVRVSNDGVRPERTASENAGEPSVAAGGGNRAVSRILAKISPDSIASIEVLKGNAATAEYGPEAAHGVIIITTKAPAKKN
jgi:TonB-dependent SusC/RagA subfamily outer membrane receptor